MKIYCSQNKTKQKQDKKNKTKTKQNKTKQKQNKKTKKGHFSDDYILKESNVAFFTLSSIKSFPVETDTGTSQSPNFYRTGNKYKTTFNSFLR